MSDIGKTALKNKIDAKIYDNESQLITGAILNEVLQDAVDTLADGGNLDAGSVDTANLNDEAVTKGKLAQNVSADLDWAVASNSYYRNSQAGDVAAKVITTNKNMSLIGGGSLKVTFEQANTADDATLNIDGKGAKPLYYNGKRVSSTNSWEANETVEIYYNNYNSGIYYAKRWMVEPVSVSQNTLSTKNKAVSISVGGNDYNIKDAALNDFVGRGNDLEIIINKNHPNSEGLVNANGWAVSGPIALQAGMIFQMNPNNELGYKFYWAVAVDENDHYISFYDANAYHEYYRITSDDILARIPTAKSIYIDFSNGTSVALSEDDVEDWNANFIYADSIVEQIKDIQSDITSTNLKIDELDARVGKDESYTFQLNKMHPNSEGTLSSNGWAMSERIKIQPNTTYTFNPNNTLGYKFYWAVAVDDNDGYINYYDANAYQEYYKIESNDILTRIPTAKYIYFDFYNSSEHPTLTSENTADWWCKGIVNGTLVSQIKELGEDVETLNAEMDELIGEKKNTFVYNSVGALSSITSPFDGTKQLKTEFYVQRTKEFGHNINFNFDNVKIVDGGVATLVHDCADDISPAQFNGTYIGGNHGDDRAREITANSHGKTAADIGSIWTIGDDECTLIGVPDANKLWFIGANELVYPKFQFKTSMFTQGATITHVSGATHTDSITISSVASLQLRPATKVSSLVIVADGKTIDTTGTYKFNSLDICENYDIINVASAVEKIQEGVGTFTSTPYLPDLEGVDIVVRISNIYHFDSANDWKVASTFTILQDINLSYYGYTQQVKLAGNLSLYIPKTLPISVGGSTFDFRTMPSFDSIPAEIDITSPYYENPQLPPDRWIEKGNVTIHSGYLFDYGVGGNNRKDVIGFAFMIPTTRKIYPIGIHTTHVNNNAGHAYYAVVWRKYLPSNTINVNGVISATTFEYEGKLYIYGDYNLAGLYEIEIPDKYLGKTINVFEKSDNVTLLTPLSTKKVLINVQSASPMYGYIVAQIK